MLSTKPLFHDEIVCTLFFGVYRFDIEDLWQAQKIEAFVVLFMQNHEHLVCDMHDLLEELVSDEVSLDEIPTIDMVD